MSDTIARTKFFDRIGNLFRRPEHEGDLTREQKTAGETENAAESTHLAAPNLSALIELDERSRQPAQGDASEPRTTFLRPWVKRDQAIEQLQNGVAALTDLMGTIRENLVRDSARQDELLNYLSRMQAIESLPESSRVQGEALKAIQAGIEQQNTHQGRLSDLLERMHRSDAQVMENLREKIGSRDVELEQFIRRQHTRFTMMLTLGIVISMAALTAVVVFGFMSYGAMNHLR